MTTNLPASHAKQIANFLQKQRTVRGRLIFALDATASRQPTWDASVQLQAQMFEEAGKIGGLEVQLVYYRGLDECTPSHWTIDARELANVMSRIVCIAGETQIAKILAHVRKEHARQAVSAVVFVGDMCEEAPHALYDAAAGLGVPLFVFQEGDADLDERIAHAAPVFEEMVRLTKPRGAYRKFSSGSARELAELLRAAAVYAVGGEKALAHLPTDSARKLLGQLK